MSAVLASALLEKPVLSTDGRELGTVYGLTTQRRTGSLRTLLVEPNGNANGFDELETTGDECIRTPPAAISGFDDHLLVTLSG